MYSRTESREGQGPRSVRGVDLGQERENKEIRVRNDRALSCLRCTCDYSHLSGALLGNKRALCMPTLHTMHSCDMLLYE